MDLATIRAALEEDYQANRALIAGLRDADLVRPTANRGWRVRQLAAHIAEDSGGVLYVGKLLSRGKSARAPDIVVNLANWWTVRKHRRADVADLLGVLEVRHRTLMHWVGSLPPKALLQAGTISQLGRLTLGEFLVQSGRHSRGHAAEIHVALDRGCDPDHGRTGCADE